MNTRHSLITPRPGTFHRVLFAAAYYVAVALLPLTLAACDSAGDVDPPGEPLPDAWTRVTGVPASTVDALAVDGSALYAGAGDRIYRSQNGGASWTASAPLPSSAQIENDPEVASLFVSGDRLVVGTFQHGAFETRDGGTTWSALSDGLSGAAARVALRFAARGSHLYVGTGGAGIFRRPLDGSGSWQPFRSGMPNRVAWDVGDIVTAGDRLIAGAGAVGAVYLNASEDGPWSEVVYVTGASGATVYDIEAVGSTLLLGASNGLYRSTDQGETWTRLNVITTGRVNAVAFARGPSALYAAIMATGRDGTRLYASTDDGATWAPVADLSGTMTYDLDVQGGRLFAGRGDGLWSIPLSALE